MGTEIATGPVNGQAPGRRELERALARVSEGHFAEASAHFARVRDTLPATEQPLAAVLDAFVAGHARYWQAQQALHEASRRFVAALAEQQARLADLRALIGARGAAPEMPPTGRAAATRRPPSPGSAPAAGPAPVAERGEPAVPPGLEVTCFGRFETRRQGRPLPLCRNRNGQAILRYLVVHPRRRETIDGLMEALWPEDEPEVARHKLHCAASALRRALNGDYPCAKGGGYLLCEGQVYALNPAIALATDVDAFLAHHRTGAAAGGAAAVPHFEAACRLYTGPLLPEDLYADWSTIRREQLAQTFLSMCNALTLHLLLAGRPDDAAGWALRALEENRCDEAAYRQLMRAYAAAGNRAEALRQYHRCEQMLAEQLDVPPMPETTALFHALARGESPFATLGAAAAAPRVARAV